MWYIYEPQFMRILFACDGNDKKMNQAKFSTNVIFWFKSNVFLQVCPIF